MTEEEWFKQLFEGLSRSSFRSRFHLKEQDKAYVRQKGMDTIRQHAWDFIEKRLAPAVIPNDRKQTPMRGHPVFIAQHATATCCRGCLEKWHKIRKGRELTPRQKEYIVKVIMLWIEREMERCCQEIATKRLLLRKLHKEDRGFFYKLLRDQKVNRFLPWFPVKSMEETEQFLKEKYLAVYENGQGYAYVICLKESGMPVGIKRFIRRS